jgi:hypothetical protein
MTFRFNSVHFREPLARARIVSAVRVSRTEPRSRKRRSAAGNPAFGDFGLHQSFRAFLLKGKGSARFEAKRTVSVG